MIQFFSDPGLAVYANPRTTYAQTPATMMGGQGMMPPMGAMMGMMGGMGPMMGGGGPTDHYGPAHGAAVGGGYSAYGGAPGSAPPPSGAGGGAVGYGKPEYGFPSQQARINMYCYHFFLIVCVHTFWHLKCLFRLFQARESVVIIIFF